MGDQAMKALPPTSHAHTVIYALSEASPLTLTTLQSCTINQTSSPTQEPVRDILQSSHTMVKTMTAEVPSCLQCSQEEGSMGSFSINSFYSDISMH